MSLHRLTRGWRPFVVLCLAILFPEVCLSEATTHCRMCGMDSAKSQTEFVARLDDGREEHTCCLHCVLLLQGFSRERTIVTLMTRDFASGELTNARRARYVAGSRLMPKGSMAPFLLAFTDREKAEQHVRRYGGRVVEFAQAMGLVESFDRELGDVE
ncbi:MAG: nitrous oxide reductase accessory protein NosL [Candidatus Riflebacteria bacterium]|nr:nitrous oxide reductase accessory protein NosL [Candidatus Riflebacteria bacterium]